MKIIYVAHGHFWGSTWPYSYIDNYIVNSIKSLGHQVRVFDFFSRAEIFYQPLKQIAASQKLSDDQLLTIMEERASSDLPLEALEFEPDFILHIVGRLSTRSLKAIKKTKIPTVVWFLDDPQELKTTVQKALFYDRVFTVEPGAPGAYLKAGNKNAGYLPLAADPAVQRPLEKVAPEYISDICLVGVPFPNRVELFDRLADFFKNYRVRIIGGGAAVGANSDGGGWLWGSQLKRLDVYQGVIRDEMISPEEAARYYNGARINLNLHRSGSDQRFSQDENLGVTASGVNGRTFEIAGCRAFQILDDNRNSGDFFEKGKEIVTFKDDRDLMEKISYYLAHEPERLEVAGRAYQKIIANHTYQHRLQKIIDSI